jgi:ADP-ribose pyrophosphatase
MAIVGFAAMPGSIAEATHRTEEAKPNRYQSQSATSLCGTFCAHALLYIVNMANSSTRKKTASGKTQSLKKGAQARLLSSRTVYRGPVFWVTTDHVAEPNGVRARRDVIHHSGSVVVLAVDDSGSSPRVLLERQYRHAAQDYLWELPAGRIDPGEQELKAAKRELLEETGYTAEKWRRIFKFYASPGFVAETMAVYLATGLRQGEAQPEEDEVIQKRMVPLKMAVSMVLGGTIRDAKTISSILWLDHVRRTKQVGNRT